MNDPRTTRRALLIDQYELTMAQAYLAGGMEERATFSLFVRELPDSRNLLLACGLEAVLDWLEALRFDGETLAYLESLGLSSRLLGWLEGLRFEGDVRAMPEGTPFFPDEPVLEVDAPLPQAQLVESFVMNQIHSQTVLASKASRVVRAAAGRRVLDFGLRRMHGADGAVWGARAYHVAGLTGTSNVAAGERFDVTVSGTMAHSFVQAFDDELDAFRAFVREFPETILLVDTYDTMEGIEKVIRLAREIGDGFGVRGVRIDSGDLGDLATRARARLDEAGLDDLIVVVSGGLTDLDIARLVAEGRPIDGFGVGTSMGVSEDAPKLDMAYKLVEYAGVGRMKTSTGKVTLPGRKQVFRQDGRDVIARHGESLPGRPLLEPVMEGGRRTEAAPRGEADGGRARARRELAALPARVTALEPADPPYEVVRSEAMEAHLAEVRRRVSGGG
ncbi:MAG TPA: nicotinate phosphoribosyltransferase [Sandaracinaceae bacterium LLY-WYZ-13_1]|nr:nicotinate phosphoribosyltransferase [Sandaracinaceae bacterium LLY-WYZ-13_1]